MYNFLIYFICVSFLSCFLIILNYIFNINKIDYHKNSAYECGFEPFGTTRTFFDVHFYTIGLLFLIFDIEIIFLLPFLIDTVYVTSFHSYLFFILFMFFIILGLAYEWSLGLLNFIVINKDLVDFNNE